MAGVYHWFDCKDHASLKSCSSSSFSIVGNLRLFMKLFPIPWPTKSLTTEKPLASACFWIAAPIYLNSTSYFHCLDTKFKTLFGYSHELFYFGAGLPTKKVLESRMIPVNYRSDINVDNITLLFLLGAWNTVAHYVFTGAFDLGKP